MPQKKVVVDVVFADSLEKNRLNVVDHALCLSVQDEYLQVGTHGSLSLQNDQVSVAQLLRGQHPL